MSSIGRGTPVTPTVFALSELLSILFARQELDHFLLEHYEEILRVLPRESPDEQYFDAAVLALFRRGLVDNTLWSRLVHVRPKQNGRITHVFENRRGDQKTKNFEQAETSRKLGLTFSSPIEELTVEKLEALVTFLRTQMRDGATVIVDVRDGSIRLSIRAAPRACQSLLKKWRSDPGELRSTILTLTGLVLIDIFDPSASDEGGPDAYHDLESKHTS